MNKFALFKLNEFCAANSIEYAVTGSTALSLLGVPTNLVPQDIDIKVSRLTEEQAKKLKELQLLSGLEDEKYDDGRCFSFTVCSIKINVLCDYTNGNSDNQTVSISLIDEEHKKHHIIKVQLVKHALTDKMKLNRPKDKTYLIDLIKNLTSLV